VDDRRRTLVVVPSTIGIALVALKPLDEADGAVVPVEPVGDDAADGPRVGDVVAFAAGLAVVVAGLWLSSTALTVIGVVVAVVGAVLPIRSLGRRAASRADPVARAVPNGSAVMAVRTPETIAIADAYHRILAITDTSDVAERRTALDAVREVASLLGGRDPAGAAETEYVRARATALETLAETILARSPRRGL
jgi:hypothetical protein